MNEFVQTAWTFATALAFALFLVAIFSVSGYRSRMPASRFLLWIAAVTLLPIVGPIVWLVRYRRAYPPTEESLLLQPKRPGIR